ncbi:MAG: hypothetical protein ACQKBT_00790, partial [Puniceicoccales bacterium]
MKINSILFCTLFLALAGTAYPQDQGDPVAVNVAIYPWLPPTPLPAVVSSKKHVEQYRPTRMNWFVRSGEEFAPIRLQENVLSKWVDYSGSRLLCLYDSLPAGEEVPRPISQVELPVGVRDVLLILFKGQNDEFVLFPITFNEADFLEGQIKIVNMGQKEVVGRAGDSRLRIAPGETLDYYVPEDDRGNRVAFAYKSDEQWKPFFDSYV